ncbi:hypothetical protein [Streptomyces sp. NPDC005143]
MGRRKPNKPRRERPRPAATWREMDQEKFLSAVEVGVEAAVEQNAIVALELEHDGDRFQILTYETFKGFGEEGVIRACVNESLIFFSDVMELEGIANGFPNLGSPMVYHHNNGREVKVFICPPLDDDLIVGALAFAIEEANK